MESVSENGMGSSNGSVLTIRDLKVAVEETPILQGVDLEVGWGELHAVMGPNGSGKSTLCHALSGKDGYQVSGSARLDGEELLDKGVDERAQLGLLQAFQYPVEIPGVSLSDLFAEAAEERGISLEEMTSRSDKVAEVLEAKQFLSRSLNFDLSGGEKKRSEVMQMMVLRPKLALLDEIDSGLDIDAVREAAAAVEQMRSPQMGVLLITHYSRILRYLKADRIHVILGGKIAVSGGPELAEELEAGGYEKLRERLGIAAPPTSSASEPDPFSDLPF